MSIGKDYGKADAFRALHPPPEGRGFSRVLVKGISDKQAEAIGNLIADQKDVFAKAFKGKPEALAEEILGYDVEPD